MQQVEAVVVFCYGLLMFAGFAVAGRLSPTSRSTSPNPTQTDARRALHLQVTLTDACGGSEAIGQRSTSGRSHVLGPRTVSRYLLVSLTRSRPRVWNGRRVKSEGRDLVTLRSTRPILFGGWWITGFSCSATRLESKPDGTGEKSPG